MISINKLFLANIIFFGSTVVALRGESKNERRKVMSKKGHGTACHDIFPRTLFNGTEVNYVKLYSAVFVEGNTTNLLLDTLCEGFVDAYAATTNCSSVPGSYREVGSCKVITEASGPGPEESYLLELLYFTNAVDGTTMFSLVEAADDAECSCNCPFGIIPGIFEGTTCTCICAPKDVNCTCTSPFVGSVVSDLDAKMASSEFQILGVHQLQLLEDCNATSTTYDYEFVCPGFESVAFAFLSTDFPSASPTAAPSVYPTDFPSEFPTEFPTSISTTGLPSSSPTSSQTTEFPTSSQTTEFPTRFPVASKSILPSVSVSPTIIGSVPGNKKRR